MVWYSHLFRSIAQFVVIHTVKGFSVGNEAEVNAFLDLLRITGANSLIQVNRSKLFRDESSDWCV